MSEYINFWTIFFCSLGLIIAIGLYIFLHRKKKHKLHLIVLFPNYKNQQKMQNSITLVDTNPHTGLIVAVDQNGNVYAGTWANLKSVVADPTQDTGTIDPTNANTLDVQNVASGGGTTDVVTGDFTSVGNSVPPAGSTAFAIPDGTVFPGLTGTITIINKVPTTVQLALAVNF